LLFHGAVAVSPREFLVMRGGVDLSYVNYAQRRAIKFVKKTSRGDMNIIRRDLLYLAAIAAQISDACNRLLTLTRASALMHECAGQARSTK